MKLEVYELQSDVSSFMVPTNPQAPMGISEKGVIEMTFLHRLVILNDNEVYITNKPADNATFIRTILTPEFVFINTKLFKRKFL